MSILNRSVIALMTFLVPVAFAGTASAQAGVACSGTTCGLGGQNRAQIGDGLPLPISFAPSGGGKVTTSTIMATPGTTTTFVNKPTEGPFTQKTMKTKPFTPGGLGFRGNGLGQQGQIKPTTNATVMQTTVSPHTENNPRALTVATGIAQYHPVSQRSIGLLAFNSEVLAVKSSLIFDSPHPGTDGNSNPVFVPGGGGSAKMFAGGRPGLSTVTFCALGALNGGTPGNNFLNQCLTPKDGVTANGAGVNGIVRFSKTKNQFGGISTGRTLGTAQVFFNVNNLALGDLPCNGGTDPACAFGISVVDVQTTGLAGGPFGSTATNASFMAAPGVFTGSLGINGSVLSIGVPALTANGATIAFTGQPATSVGFPLSTGMVTVSVTDALPVTEKFIRTGTDARDANGNGVVALNSGTLSARTTSRGNANRVWVTYEIPEPSAIFAASAGLLALFGCHQLVRRRSR
jgi:hypothetical protein